MTNRENLLNCALELFVARGYEAVGVQEIAAAAGIQKPTLYHYFGSKSGLLQTLLKTDFGPFFETLQTSAAYPGDVLNGLRAVTRAYFDFARQHPRLYRFYLSMWFAPVESDPFKACLPLTEHQQQLLETFFTQAALEHGNMKNRQRTYAASFLGLINTYVMLILNGYAEPDEALVYSLVHQFMHGIFS